MLGQTTPSVKSVRASIVALKVAISPKTKRTPTKIGFHAIYIKLYLHEFFERILLFDPTSLHWIHWNFFTTPTYIGYFYCTSPGNLQQLSYTLLLNVTADFVHSLTCHECLKVYNAGNKTVLECGKGPHFSAFHFSFLTMRIRSSV